MDAETYIAAGTQVVNSSVVAGAACVQLCQSNPRRLVLILSTQSKSAQCQVVPPGMAFDPSSSLPFPIALFQAAAAAGTLMMSIADYGPLVQGEWWAQIDPAFGTWTITEVINLHLPCPEVNRPTTPQPPDLLQGLSGSRGGDDTFSMGLGKATQ